MPAPGTNATRRSHSCETRAIPSRPSTFSLWTSCAAILPTTPRAGGESAAHPTARLAGRWFRTPVSCPGTSACAPRCPIRTCSTCTRTSDPNDPDGFSCTRAELVEYLEHVSASAFVFPMHEPDGYPAANDAVAAEAAASDGRLFAFCRLDPHRAPLEEARRCLDNGARGIKLHPRAEGFNLDHPDLQAVFALADEHRLPILCHAGRGIPALGRHAVEVCSRHPGLRLILAHAGSRTSPGSGARRPPIRTCSSTPRGGRPATCRRCSRWSRPARS